MRKHAIPIMVALCVLGVVGTVLAGTTNVFTTDFQGVVTTNVYNSTNGTSYSEQRNGIWIAEDGGIFEGYAYITNVTSFGINKTIRKSVSLFKNGNLVTPTFNGRVAVSQIQVTQKNGNLTDVSSSKYIQHQGTWFISPITKLVGSIIVRQSNNGVPIVSDSRKFLNVSGGGGGVSI